MEPPTVRYPIEVKAALRWLAGHELWQDIYPDGADIHSTPRSLPPEHVRAARAALGLTAADLGYFPSPNATKK